MTSSVSRVAVLAHFDAEGLIPPQTRLLMQELLDVASRLVVVSTRLAPAQMQGWDDRVRFIVRPNVGYDFYSFKVGLENIPDPLAYDEVVIANDSVYMARSGGYRNAIEDMVGVECDAWSLTASRQVAYHMQSYFMVFRKSALLSRHMWDFWKGVRVVDSKWEIILGYEVGLSQHLVKHGLVLRSAFSPNGKDLKLLARRLHGGEGLVAEANQVHYLWDRIFEKYGILKNEVLRDDPNGVLDPPLEKVVGAELASQIDAEMERVRSLRPEAVAIDEATSFDPGDASLAQFRLSAIDASSLQARVAFVLHLFHVDLLDDMYGYMKNALMPVDVFVSVKSIEDYFVATARFRELGVRARVFIHENRGRDVGPFISLLNSGLLDRYVCVCKIHSKKSTYHQAGNRWRDDLLKGLLGTPYDVLRIVDAFEKNSDCGMVGPDNAFVTNDRFWGGNEPRLRKLAADLGVPQVRVRLGFFAGTMFWFRPSALASLKRRHIRLDEFEDEAGQRDATLAHVLERLFPLCVEQAGYFISTNRPLGRPIDHAAYAERGVPVLPG